MKKPYLSIVIPVLNLWELTRECLKSVKLHTVGKFYEVIVVDNGSSDETFAECDDLGRSLFGDRFSYIRLEKNINFGPACNVGAQKAAGEMLFFLNNDTLLTDKWFVPLLEAFKSYPKVAVCSPLCLFPDNNRVQYMGICFDGGLNVRHPYFLFPGSHSVVKKARKFQALSAAAFMVPSAIFKEFEGFFSEYTNGFEDIDLCCRIRRSGGHLIQENRSVIYHLASQTPGRNKFNAQNIELVNDRCVGCFRPDLHKIAVNDGFHCEITPWLEMIIRDTDTDRMLELSKLSGEDEIASALNEFPLWGEGYDQLAQIYFESGRQEKAAEILFYGSSLFPDRERLRSLYQIAGQVELEDYADYASRKLLSIDSAMSHPEKLKGQALKCMSWAMIGKDSELLDIYEKWLKLHFKEDGSSNF